MERRAGTIGSALVTRAMLDLAGFVGLASISAPISGVLLLGVLWTGRSMDRSGLVPPLAVGFAAVVGLAAVRGSDSLYWTALLLAPVVLLLVARRCTPEDGWRWALTLAAVSPVPLALAAWGLATGQPGLHVVNGFPRLLGGYANPHSHAVAMAVFASVGVLLAEAGRGRTRTLGLALAVLSTVVLGLTWVRTALLMLGVHLAVFLALRRRWRIAGGLVAGGLMLLLASPALQHRFSDVWALATGAEPELGWTAIGSWRVAIWADVLTSFVQEGPAALLFGLGLGGHLGLHEQGLDPHSDLIALWTQAGVAAPLLWVALVGAAAYAVYERRSLGGVDRERAFQDHALAWAVALLAASPFSNDVVPRAFLMWWVWAALGCSQGEPRSEGRREGNREVVVDPPGEQLGGGTEDRG